jgi:hypothetical protein
MQRKCCLALGEQMRLFGHTALISQGHSVNQNGLESKGVWYVQGDILTITVTQVKQPDGKLQKINERSSSYQITYIDHSCPK